MPPSNANHVKEWDETMKNTKRIVIVFLVIGLIVSGIPADGSRTAFVAREYIPGENTADGSPMKETHGNVSASAKNETDQPWSPQAFAITATRRLLGFYDVPKGAYRE